MNDIEKDVRREEKERENNVLDKLSDKEKKYLIGTYFLTTEFELPFVTNALVYELLNIKNNNRFFKVLNNFKLGYREMIKR